jgi:hypothetical protein
VVIDCALRSSPTDRQAKGGGISSGNPVALFYVRKKLAKGGKLLAPGFLLPRQNRLFSKG